MDTTEQTEKRIIIEGTNNRYQIKKLVEKKERKKRQVVSGWVLPPEYYEYEKQKTLFSSENQEKEKEKEKDATFFTLVNRELERKLASYKQQDKEKGIVDFLSLMTLEKTQKLLQTSGMQCFYCSCQVFLLYEMVREKKQWTLDRINNDLGHNEGNVVIACLECNLKRRRTNQDKFLFTKQLKIVHTF
jgi:hypothetical protein